MSIEGQGHFYTKWEKWCLHFLSVVFLLENSLLFKMFDDFYLLVLVSDRCPLGHLVVLLALLLINNLKVQVRYVSKQ